MRAFPTKAPLVIAYCEHRRIQVLNIRNAVVVNCLEQIQRLPL